MRSRRTAGAHDHHRLWPSTVNEKWAIGFTVSGQASFYRPLAESKN